MQKNIKVKKLRAMFVFEVSITKIQITQPVKIKITFLVSTPCIFLQVMLILATPALSPGNSALTKFSLPPT